MRAWLSYSYTNSFVQVNSTNNNKNRRRRTTSDAIVMDATDSRPAVERESSLLESKTNATATSKALNNSSVEFHELVSSNAFKKVFKTPQLVKDTRLETRSLSFLKNNQRVVRFSDKHSEISTTQNERTGVADVSAFDFLTKPKAFTTKHTQQAPPQFVHHQGGEEVKAKFQQPRNINIQNLIKENKSNETKLFKIQSSLKDEFRKFLNQRVEQSTDSVKQLVGVDDDRLLVENDTTPAKEENRVARMPNKWDFLTQNDSSSHTTETFPSKAPTVALPTTIDETNRRTPATIKKTRTSSSKTSNKSTEAGADNKSLIVGLVQAHDDDAADANAFPSSDALKLQKILENIKRIDLPKFQPELHQICVYGADPQLFKLYPESFELDLNTKQNSIGRYCIHECVIKGNVTMLTALLAYVEDVNKVDMNKRNAAHIAAKFGELECLRILMANQIDYEAVDEWGMNVSHIAAQYNHAGIIEYLFNMGFSLNQRDHSDKLPIHYAAKHGSLETLAVLVEYYVDLSVRDSDGNSAAHLAVINDHVNCLRLLVKSGLPVDKLNNKAGRNVTHTACLNGSIKSLHWLFHSYNTDANALDNLGNNLAHSSCLTGHAECLNCCLQHDVDFYALNKNGDTPLELAKKAGKRLHIEKAVRNEIACPYCVKDALRFKYEKENERTTAEKTVDIIKNKIYRTIDTEKNKAPADSDRSSQFFEANRDMIAQFFGPEL